MTLRVALTGGIASGKSTVSALLRERGAVLIDADLLAREVVEPGTPGLAAVVAEFGPSVLTDGGTMDREAVAAIVFGDPAAKGRLEAIIHPLVYERMIELDQRAPEGSVVIHDIPLLAEGGRADTFDAVIVVDATPEQQTQRMIDLRSMTHEEANKRLAAQCSREQRLAVATHVIDNTGTLDELERRVDQVWEQLRAAAE